MFEALACIIFLLCVLAPILKHNDVKNNTTKREHFEFVETQNGQFTPVVLSNQKTVKENRRNTNTNKKPENVIDDIFNEDEWRNDIDQTSWY